METPQNNPEQILPGTFTEHEHWYPKALNAAIHPMVLFFMTMGNDRIIKRYCHLHPTVKAADLAEVLSYKPRYFLWAGADLINVTSAGGRRQMVVIENNSCPSGQKSNPHAESQHEQGGYHLLMEGVFKPYVLHKKPKINGDLAVLYDKNLMENRGYAAAMADSFNEPVWLVPFFRHDKNNPAWFEDGVLKIRDENGQTHDIRAAFRYVTQRPWNRIPIHTRTLIFNPIIACLSGGRNKLLAAKAYDMFNADMAAKSLKINTPETIWDVSKDEIPLWVKKMGGHAVVKVPYSNAGQGVFTLVNKKELDTFMESDYEYERFIVQSLLGNYRWSSTGSSGKLYHVGTIPNLKGETYVADLRLMVSSFDDGIKPICLYARRSKVPLVDKIKDSTESWDMLGTNLSIANPDGTFGTDPTRLMLMDRKDFNKLGIGVDDLIEAYVQTVLSMMAIDQMAQNLVNSKGKFRLKLFQSLNNDQTLLDELVM